MSRWRSLLCRMLGHQEFPESRWVMDREEPFSGELWMFYICQRCDRIRFVRKSGTRWEETPAKHTTPMFKGPRPVPSSPSRPPVSWSLVFPERALQAIEEGRAARFEAEPVGTTTAQDSMPPSIPTTGATRATKPASVSGIDRSVV